MDSRAAMIAGASGLVGGQCLNRLLDSPDYIRVTAVVRHALDEEHPRLVQALVNFEALPDFESLEGADVFCALGTTLKRAGSPAAFRKVDLEYPLRLAQRAHEAGAGQFLLVSSVGANVKSKNLYLRVKGELEEEIKKIGFASLHLFRPSLLVGDRAVFRLAERLAIPLALATQFLLAGSWRRYRSVRGSDLAKAMVAAARSRAKGVWVHEWDEIQQLAGRVPESPESGR